MQWTYLVWTPVSFLSLGQKGLERRLNKPNTWQQLGYPASKPYQQWTIQLQTPLIGKFPLPFSMWPETIKPVLPLDVLKNKNKNLDIILASLSTHKYM